MSNNIEWLDWHCMYDEGWRGLIVDEAFAHPAKAARGLIRQIFTHMQAQGWLQPRSRVLDVFGGIGTTLIQGASLGHECVGVELEERFYKLALENFALHRRTWESMGDPLPVMLHGDSRRAVELVRGHFAGCVGNPPHGTAALGNGGASTRLDFLTEQKSIPANTYGQSPGQLGSMSEGDVAAAIGSPPYADGVVHSGNGIDLSKLTGNKPGSHTQAKAQGYSDAVIGSPPYAETPVVGQGNFQSAKCPDSKPARGIGEGDKGYDAVVGSPPYAESIKGDHGEVETAKESHDARSDKGQGVPGNIGAEVGETFWSAAREILLQVHQLLKPGGVCAWICKDYVKAGKRVPFCDNWARLCEACGFVVVQRVRCHLVKEETNPGLFGDVTKKTERKSFFRRLHERKPGAVRIDWEEVIFAVKVGGGQSEVAACVGSPPFHDNNVNIGSVGPTVGMRQEISGRSAKRDDAYGKTAGQLGGMKEGDAP
jgi:DNA modification methylase